MKKICLCLLTFFSFSAFAESGFSQIKKLFLEGFVLDLNVIQTMDKGMYVGRCFNANNNYPYGAGAAFKNLSHDSGPITVDPELHIGFNWSQQSNYFDQVVVQTFIEKLQMSKADKKMDSVSYEIIQQSWQLQYRMNGNYIVQKNIVNGAEDSYCYFYSFRLK